MANFLDNLVVRLDSLVVKANLDSQTAAIQVSIFTEFR